VGEELNHTTARKPGLLEIIQYSLHWINLDWYVVYIFRVDLVVLKKILIFKAVNTKSLESSDSWEYDHIFSYWLAIVYLMKIYVRTAQVGLKT
jgi:hypothetical protein